MKKSRIVGYALTLAATLFVGSAMGQTFKALPTTANNGVDGHFKNFVQVKSTGLVNGETATGENLSLVQIGKSFLFVVQPDAAAHPSYDTNRKLTKDYQWEWNMKDTATAVAAFPAGNKHINVVDGTFLNDANSQVYSFPATGYYNIKVEAKYPAAFGATCSGNIRFFDILALPAPSFTTTQATPATVANAICVTSATKPEGTATFNIKATGTPRVNYKLTKETYDLATGVWNTATDITAYTTAAKETNYAEQWDWDQVAGVTTAEVDSSTVKLNTAVISTKGSEALAAYVLSIKRAFSIPTQAEKLVRYTIVLQGVNSSLSRKADYAAKGIAPSKFSFYENDGTEVAPAAIAPFYTFAPAKTESYSFVYAIAPSTGPVYHLSNNVAR